MREIRYVLDEAGNALPERDLLTWATWYEANNSKRVVARTTISDDVTVSTVFLGLDYNFLSVGPPVLWETMIFGGKHNEAQWRYRSREEAEAGHTLAVKVAKGEAEYED